MPAPIVTISRSERPTATEPEPKYLTFRTIWVTGGPAWPGSCPGRQVDREGAKLVLPSPCRGLHERASQRGRCERRGASRSGVTNHLRIDRTSPIPSGRGTWRIIEFAGLKVRAERGRGSDRDRRTLPVAPATIAAAELELGSGSEMSRVTRKGWRGSWRGCRPNRAATGARWSRPRNLDPIPGSYAARLAWGSPAARSFAFSLA